MANDMKEQDPVIAVDTDEQKKFKLIRFLRAKLGVLMWKQNEMEPLMNDTSGSIDKETIKLKCGLFENAVEEFVQLHNYIQKLMSEEEQECDQCDWFEPKMKIFKDCLSNVNRWMDLSAYEGHIKLSEEHQRGHTDPDQVEVPEALCF